MKNFSIFSLFHVDILYEILLLLVKMNENFIKGLFVSFMSIYLWNVNLRVGI